MTDDRFTDVLTRALAASRSPEVCPNAEQLAAFVDNGQGKLERAACMAHVAECADCQARVAAMIRTDESVRAPDAMAEGQARFWRWLDWRGLALVAGMAVVVIAVRITTPVTLPRVGSPESSVDELGEAAPPRSVSSPVSASPAESPGAVPDAAGPRLERAAAVEARTAAMGAARTAPSESTAQNEDLSQAAVRFQRRQAFSGPSSAPAVVAAPGGAVRWRAQPGGVIEVSVDGGGQWSQQIRRDDVQWSAGSASTSAVCWWVGSGGAIVRTIDGGETWSTIIPPAADDFIGVRGLDAETAEVSHADGQVSVTTDGGATWAMRP